MAIEVLLESFVSLAVYVVLALMLRELVLNNNGCGTWPDVI